MQRGSSSLDSHVTVTLLQGYSSGFVGSLYQATTNASQWSCVIAATKLARGRVVVKPVFKSQSSYWVGW
jgi:hypothetical protein